MHQTIKYFRLELKKGIRELPYALLGTLFLCLILGTICFCASKLLYQPTELNRSSVAVVTGDREDPYLRLAINLVSGMESTSLALDFNMMTKDDALKALSDHRVAAVLLLPDRLLEGIMDGSNPPIRVLFSTSDTLSSVFLTELTRAGATMLSAAQADIYVADTLYRSLGKEEALSSAYDDINLFNLNYALNRDQLFQSDQISFHGTSNTLIFYLATAVMMILLFLTTVFTAMLRRENRDFYQLLFHENNHSVLYLSAKLCSFAIIFFLIQLLFYTLASMLLRITDIDFLPPAFHGSYLLFFLLNAFFLAAYSNLIFLSAKDVSGGILISYCISAVMAFCSGCIIPGVFFPSSLQKISVLLPTYYIQKNFISLINGAPLTFSLLYVFSPVLLFFLCIIVFNCRRRYHCL